MKINYSISDLWKIFWHNIIIVILSGILFGGATYLFFSHHQTATYTAQRTITVYHTGDVAKEANLIQADVLSMNTYASVINDPVVMTHVYNDMKATKNFSYTKKNITKQIVVVPAPNSASMTINASANNSAIAIKMANVTAEVAKDTLPQYIKHSAKIRLLANANQRAVSKTVTPNVKKLSIYGLAVGIILGALLSFGIDLIKNQQK